MRRGFTGAILLVVLLFFVDTFLLARQGVVTAAEVKETYDVDDETDAVKKADEPDGETGAEKQHSIEETKDQIIREATQYLVDNYEDDGSYSDGYSYNTTAEVCFVLNSYTEEDTRKSVDWLKQQDYSNNIDNLSRFIIASNETALIDTVLRTQNVDGGFGLNSEFQSDVPDSLLVLEAANRVNSPEYAGNLKRLTGYITDKSYGNGSYPYVEGGEEDIILSSRVLYNLIVYNKNYSDDNSSLVRSISKTINYIKTEYDVDFSQESIEKNLYAAIALQEAGERVDYENAVKALFDVQKENGSFYNNAHFTALVIWFLGNYTEKERFIADEYVEPTGHKPGSDTDKVDESKSEEADSNTGISNQQHEGHDVEGSGQQQTGKEAEIISDTEEKTADDKGEKPKTSDDFNSGMIIVFAVSGLAILLLVFLKKKKRSTGRKVLSVVLIISVVMTSFSGVRASADTDEDNLSISNRAVKDIDKQAENQGLIDVVTPLEIYNYVRKNVRSEAGLKGSRSLDEILSDKKSSAAENVILFGKLLSDRGYKTKYVLGRALLTGEQLKWITGADTVAGAEEEYKKLGIDIEKKEQADGTALFAVPHIWIRTFVPVTDYRCAGNNGGRYEWLELDAYVKNNDVESVGELSLIPHSLPYGTEGMVENEKPVIYDELPEDLFVDQETTTEKEVTEDTTENIAEDTTEKGSTESITTGEQIIEDPTTEKPDDQTTEEPSKTTAEDPTTEKTEEPTTEEPDEEGAFFRVFDSADDFVTGDGQLDIDGRQLDSNAFFGTTVLGENQFNVRLGSDEAGITLDKDEHKYLTWGTEYYFSDFDVYQALDTQLDGQNDKYKGEYRLVFKTHSQPETINLYKDHAYAVSNETRSWDDAEKACESMGGHLVIIDDAEENAYIRDIANESGNGGYVAIGYTDRDNEGRWKWVAPTDSTFEGWHSGEPNDGIGYNAQDHAYMYSDGTWDDGWEGFHYYVCEWDNIDAVGTYDMSSVTLVMEVSDKVGLNIAEDQDVIITDLKNGYKQLIFNIDLSSVDRFTVPVEIDKDKVYSTLIKNINLFYSTGLADKDEKLGNVSFENTDYAESGLWSAVVDSGKNGSVWNYLDIDALYEMSGYTVVCAAASDNVGDAAYYRNGYGRRISTDEMYSEQGLQNLVGRYLYISVYVEPGVKNTVPFINRIKVGADTEKRPVKRDKKYSEIRINGDDVVDIDSKSSYEFYVITNEQNEDDVVWCVNGKAVENIYTSFNYIFSDSEEGEYTLKAYFRDDPEHYAEKTVTVVRAENHDLKNAINERLKYPYFNMYLDKTAYYSGDDIKVITDIPDDADVEMMFDGKANEAVLTEGSFVIEDVTTGNHRISISIKNKSGNRFSRTINVNVYDVGPSVKTWFDKDKYFSGDDVTLFVEEGYRFVDALIDGRGNEKDEDNSGADGGDTATDGGIDDENDILHISESGDSVRFNKPSSGNHVLNVSLVKLNDETESGDPESGEPENTDPEADNEEIKLQIYLFINSGRVTPTLDDVVTVYDNDKTPPVAEIISPEADTELSGKVQIVCTVKDELKLNKYTVKCCKLDAEGEVVSEDIFCEGTENIVEETVGEIDTDKLTEGDYKIVLEAWDMAGNSSYSEIIITVTEVEEQTTEEEEEPTTEDVENPTTEEPEEPTTEDLEEPSTEEPYEPENPDDKTAPTVSIITPAEGDILKAPTDIKGSAYDESELSFWRLEYRAADSVDYTLIKEGIENISSGVIGNFDTTLLMNGRYEIRLTAMDKGGNTATASRNVYVEGNLKVGNMHIGFTDLTDNIGKAGVSVNRIYDSRNKESGDFGYGWSMDTSGMKLIENHPITDGYDMSISGSAFRMTYRLYETVSHDVIVTYGDGSSDRFSLVINGGTRTLTPVDEVSFSYRCVTDPKLSLEILADTTAYYDYGELLFDDEDIYDLYDFKLTDGDGTIYYLSKTSGVYRIEDNYGRVVNIDRNGYHGQDGQGISFTRDSKGRITSIKNSDGKTVVYTYDKKGDLTEVKDSAGRVVSFTYDSDHNLLSIIDPEGHTVARNEYDDAGRLIATIDADGKRTEYSHNVDGREELITDRLGNSTLYIYDDNGNIISKTDANGNTTETTYDEYGNILTYKDAEGNVTVSSYDASGNLTSVTDAEGNNISVEYDTANRPVKLVTVDDAVMKIAYDSKGEITETTDVDESVISYERDADGNVKSITDEIGKVLSSEYDSLGRVIATTDAAGNRVEYTYDSEGHKLTETYTVTTSDGEVSRTIKYNYNDAGELISTEDPDGHISTIERNNLGQTTAIIDSEGRRTSYEYDKLGNTTKISYPDGTSESFIYDAEGNLTSATGRTGNTAEYTYDKVGNLKKIHDARGNDTLYDYDRNYNLTAVTYATGAKISYKYDSLNRNTEVTDNDENTTYFTYDSRSLLTSVTDAKGNVTRYEYNTKGERIKVIYPDETSASIELDVRGRVTAKIDTAGNRTEYTYDGSDRLISVKQPDGSVTEYTYDKTGNLLSFKDANGRVTRYEYDDHQRVIRTTLPDGSESTVEYDIHGYVTSTTGPDGSVTSFDYDTLGRSVSITKTGVRNGAEVSTTTECTYDEYGRVTEVIERSSGSHATTSSVSYIYDDYGYVISKTYDNGQTVSYGYDIYGRCNEVSVSSAGTTLTTGYEYDSMDRLTRVISHDGKATVYTYDENGNRSTATYANGVTLTYTYDECNRLKVEKVTDKNQNLIAQYEYTTTGGERTAVSESYPDGTTIETEYSYDNCGRLVSENIIEKKSGEETVTDIQYTYDRVGSRTSKTVNGITTEYDYNELNQLVREKTTNADGQVSQTEYSYDSNGNLTRTVSDSKICDYSYDLYNRMTGFTDGIVSYGYTYDAEGVRRSKTSYNESSSKTTLYVSDTFTDYAQTLAETDEAGVIKISYTVGFELINSTRFNQSADTDLYYILDGHSDVRLLLDESATVKSSFRYSAYGEMLGFTGVVTDGYYYTGEYMDFETGLYYLRARYMDPATATFTSMDSYAGNIYEPASLHRYLYANANPVKYCDPSGHSPLASLTTSVSQLTMLQTNALILSMAAMSGLMNMAVRAVTCLVTDGRLPNGKEFGSAFLEGFYIGSLIGSLTVFVALYANLTLFEMSICMAGASTVQSVIGGAISSYKGDGVGIVINTLSAVLSAVAFSKFYGLKTETITVKNSGKANKVESKPDGTSEPKNNVPSGEAETPKTSYGKSGENVAKVGSASGKNKLALGLSESLDDFALKNGASTWKDFPDPTNWKNGVLDALYDSNTEIIVNLDGVDNPLSSIQRAAGGYGGATDWELLQIKLTPESWDRITWYKNGNVVPNPFEY